MNKYIEPNRESDGAAERIAINCNQPSIRCGYESTNRYQKTKSMPRNEQIVNNQSQYIKKSEDLYKKLINEINEKNLQSLTVSSDRKMRNC